MPNFRILQAPNWRQLDGHKMDTRLYEPELESHQTTGPPPHPPSRFLYVSTWFIVTFLMVTCHQLVTCTPGSLIASRFGLERKQANRSSRSWPARGKNRCWRMRRAIMMTICSEMDPTLERIEALANNGTFCRFLARSPFCSPPICSQPGWLDSPIWPPPIFGHEIQVVRSSLVTWLRSLSLSPRWISIANVGPASS